MDHFSKKPLNVDELAISAIRSLLIDEIDNANSGHPGMALDVAPSLYTLWKKFLINDPKHPNWFNRDRFVLSSGHNSALLYALLHCAGFNLTIDDLKQFRQLNSKTPGHPEVGVTPGIDATSGPLGQGLATAVGMAMAEEKIAASYPEGYRLCSHFTYCLCGDGCLEEGISQEAISLAGKLRLNKLILIYDANGSTLDDDTSLSMDEDTKLRFMSAHWNVYEVKDGNDISAIAAFIAKARSSTLFPSIIIVHSKIGYGTPLEGSHLSHGAPLGEANAIKAKEFYNYDYPPFTVAPSVYETFASSFGKRGEEAYLAYQKDLEEYKKKYPKEYQDFENSLKRDISSYDLKDPDLLGKPESTRNASGRYLNALVKAVPFTFGGSADVASSVKTALKDEKTFLPNSLDGKNIAFGIREFEMAAACNGIILHGGLISYCGSFLVFSDYMRNAIRMSALEKLPSIYLFSHDSIAVGEDGPTHEPIEHVSSLRLIPNLRVLRPCDSRETFASWRVALESKETPTCLILSRQNLPLIETSSSEGVVKGAYIIRKAKSPKESFLASGSEVSSALSLANKVDPKGNSIDVISVPDFGALEKMSEEEIKDILRTPYENRFAFEMGQGALWYRFAKHVKGISTFGASGKAEDVIKAFGFDEDGLLSFYQKEKNK